MFVYNDDEELYRRDEVENVTKPCIEICIDYKNSNKTDFYTKTQKFYVYDRSNH